MKLAIPLVLLFYSTHLTAQFTTNTARTYAVNVKDSFDIFTSLPPGYNPQQTYKVVYYCDANLKSGNLLRQKLSATTYNATLNDYIFIGIGHIGNFHVLRRRDFILPFIKGNDTVPKNETYGQVERFYTFLKNELIPSINTRYKTYPDSNSIIGHSLGGLFAFYSLFKSDDLFNKYFALSPALWIDDYAVYRFNKIKDGFSVRKHLYFTAGSKEWMNRILKGCNRARKFLDEKKYRQLIYTYEIHKKHSHNSAVGPALDRIFREML